VLGSAAGGGLPQWNCGCQNCRDVRAGHAQIRARTQESVAISADGEHWFLLNASPEIRAQIESFPPLHPRAARHCPIAGIVLTNGDLDHCLGLLSLRESHPLRVYASEAVRDGWVDGNLLHRTLQRFPQQVTWQALTAARCPLLLSDGRASGLFISAVPTPGKLPIHLEGLRTPSELDNVGLLIDEPSRQQTLAYFPAVGASSAELRQAIATADCVFFDGTFWSSDELASQGLGDKRAEDMAHWPVGGPHGSLSFLAALSPAGPSAPAPVREVRRVLIHINNTNPILREDSAPAAQLRAASLEVAYDGMEIEL
jgi:pyrroloquinoline quinone biosynthesis protein B